jgi:hypothetical protein
LDVVADENVSHVLAARSRSNRHAGVATNVLHGLCHRKGDIYGKKGCADNKHNKLLYPY